MEEKFNVEAKTDSEPDGLGLRGINPYSLLINCVTTGKILNLSEPQFHM